MQSNFNHLKKTLGIVIGLIIIIRFSLYILNHSFKLYFLAGAVNQYAINTFLNITLILLVMIILVFITPRKGLRATVIVIGIMVLLYTSYISLWTNDGSKYYCFNSPNKKATLIIEENSWLLAGWSNFYVKKAPLFMKKLDHRITTDDGYRPFSMRDYNLSWIDNRTVEITFGNGQNGVDKVTALIK